MTQFCFCGQKLPKGGSSCGNFGRVAWGCHWALAGQAQCLVPTGQFWSGPVLWPMGGLTSVYQ